MEHLHRSFTLKEFKIIPLELFSCLIFEYQDGINTFFNFDFNCE